MKKHFYTTIARALLSMLVIGCSCLSGWSQAIRNDLTLANDTLAPGVVTIKTMENITLGGTGKFLVGNQTTARIFSKRVVIGSGVTIVQGSKAKLGKIEDAGSLSLSASDNALFSAVKLTWTPLPGMDGYRVYKNDSVIAVINNPSANEYIDESASSGNIYTYCLDAFKMGTPMQIHRETGQACDQGTTMPYIFTASDGTSDGYVNLDWTLDVNCLEGNSGEKVYLAVTNEADNKEVYSQIFEAKDLAKYRVREDYQPGYALDFNGISTTGTIGTISPAIPTNDWTAELLIKRTNLNAPSYATLLNSGDQSIQLYQNGKIGLALTLKRIKKGGPVIEYYEPHSFDVNTNVHIPYNRWTMLSFVSRAGKTYLYINGEQKGVIDYTFPCPVSTVGKGPLNDYFTGLLGEIRVWNRSRTAEEIRNNYNFRGFTGNEANLSAIWALDRASGTVVNSTGDNVPFTLQHHLWKPYVAPDNENIAVQGSFTHFVGDNASRTYRMSMYVVGSGDQLCSSLTDPGNTLPFKPPVLTTSQDDPGKIVLEWTDSSDVADKYLIYRDGALISSVNGQAGGSASYTFTDLFRFNDSTSIKNGKVYQYCVRGFNKSLAKEYSASCAQGSTPALSFAASDNTFEDKVVLTWDKVKPFADTVKITRDGVDIEYVAAAKGTFTDIFPTYGKKHRYGLSVIKNGKAYAAVYDQGSVKANGRIAGRITTIKDKWAIPGVSVKAVAAIDGVSHEVNTTTDYNGAFLFDTLFYGTTATYTVTAVYAGHSFEVNPISVSLSRLAPRSDSVLFGDQKVYRSALKNDVIQLSALRDTVASDINALAFAWDYNYRPNKTTVFKVYRDETIIDYLNDEKGKISSFEDRGGTPGAHHQYKVIAYYFASTDAVDYVSSDQLDALYPIISAVGALQASANPLAGTVDLSWSYTSANYSGFVLFRDGKEIARLKKDAFAFTDKKGYPSAAHIYGIAVRCDVSGADKDSVLYSTKTSATAVIYPALPVPDTARINIVNDDRITVTWSFGRSVSYNYTGFHVYRNGQRIGAIMKNFPLEITDKQGIPNQPTAYSVRTFLSSDTLDTESAASQATVNYPFPQLQTPFGLSANSHPGYVTLQWQYTSTNLDGFVIQRNGITVDTLRDVGARKYSHVINNSGISGSQEYTVFAIAKRVGAWRASLPASVTTIITSNTGTLQAPTQFLVSDVFGTHVQLRWTYPVYIYASFEIRRDGTPIDTVGTDFRVYYDKTSQPGVTHVYQIRALYSNKTSAFVSATGQLYTFNTISGLVQTDSSRSAVPGVEVEAKGNVGDNVYYQKVYTDSTGFFQFKEVPEILSGQVVVSVFKQNQAFRESTSLVTMAADQHAYETNFYALYEESTAPENLEAARITNITAVPDPMNFAAIVRWTSNNGNYSGFKVFRDFAEIADVVKGKEMKVIDTTGIPGILHTYSVRAYWTLPEGVHESALKSTAMPFPTLYQISYLQATPVPAEDIVELSWSHEKDNHTHYEIYRQGKLIGVVPARQTLSYADTTGIPGHLYSYEVYAVLVRGHSIYKSAPMSKIVNFPQVATPAVSNPLKTANAIHINWNHTSRYHRGFKVLRDGKQVAMFSKASGVRTFVDSLGLPESRHAYGIVAYAVRDSVEYESAPGSVAVSFPPLSAVTGFSAIPISGQDYIQLSWNYPSRKVEGFRIYRNGSLYQTIKGAGINSFQDRNGVPGAAYEYAITAFAKRGSENSLYESGRVSSSAVFPTLSAPQVFAGSAYNTYASLSWQYPGINHDGFVVSAYIFFPYINLRQAQLEKGKRTWEDVHNSNNYSYTYVIKAYKVIGGTTYYSNEVLINSLAYTNPQPLNTKPTSLVASDGDFANKVKITWVKPIVDGASSISKYNIYRDRELIGEAVSSAELFYDTDVIPGKKYVYSITTVVAAGTTSTESAQVSDQGYSKLNGSIKGSVITDKQGSGVPGIAVKASGVIKGEIYEQTKITDSKGEFNFDALYYGDSAKYTITASYADHSFVNNNQLVKINSQNAWGVITPIRDESAFIVQGRAYQPGVSGGPDSVEVTLKMVTQFSNSDQKTKTDVDGKYSFAINPYQDKLLSYQLKVAGIGVTGNLEKKDTTWHAFEKHTVTLTPSQLTNITTTVNFRDTIAYPVRVSVENTCGSMGNYKFLLRIQDEKGVYDSTFVTDVTGKALLKLPALKYIIRVKGVENATAEMTPIIDYLKVRPLKLDLLSLHNSFRKKLITRRDVAQKSVVNIIYHNQPDIQIADGLGNRYLCGDPKKGVILDFDENTYTLDLNVQEKHGNEYCAVEEGYLLVKNFGSKKPNEVDTVMYSKALGGFESYTFEKGSPNLIYPYKQNLILEYHTEKDGFLGEYIQPLVVEGVGNIPGKDIIVNPSTGRRTENSRNVSKDVQIPLMILRDPPGDNSFSFVKKGTSFEKEYKWSESHEGGLATGFNSENYFVIVGTSTNLKVAIGGGGGKERVMKVSTELTENIETSKKSQSSTNLKGYLDGEDADVIVGLGVAMQYGMSQVIKVDRDGCTIRDTLKLTVSPSDINTTWNYTVSHINHLVDEYDLRERQAASGDFDIQGLELADLQTIKKNWEKVLEYHSVKTLPAYQVCYNQDSIKTAYQTITESNVWPADWPGKKNALNDKLTNFCSKAYPGSTISDLRYEVTWDQATIDSYNAFRKAFTDFKEDFLRLQAGVEPAAWNRYKLFKDYATYLKSLNFAGAENITFSGGTAVERAVETKGGVTTGLEQSFFISEELGFEFNTETELNLAFHQWAGFGAGIEVDLPGAVKTKVKIDIFIEQEYKFELKESSSIDSTQFYEVGYALEDDDDGDQFSVTVIQNPLPGYTPYFSLLGGRSSCPYEGGTIPRDMPDIDLGDPQGNPYNTTFYDLDPNQMTEIPLKLASGNQFGEDRMVSISLATNANSQNLRLYAQSARVTTSKGPVLWMPADTVSYVNLYADRNPLFYDYDDIYLVAKPQCATVFEESFVMDTLKLSLHYRKPCSPVTIIEPEGAFAIRKAPAGQEEKLNLKLSDYVVEGDVMDLDVIRLEYKHDEAEEWEAMSTITQDTLLSYFDRYKHIYFKPTYNYMWNIAHLNIPDGPYKIRAVSDCGTNGSVVSNILSGVIDRTPIALSGYPEPVDGILSMGEEIAVSFSEAITCLPFGAGNYSVMNTTDNVPVPVKTVCNGTRIVFQPQTDVNLLKGKTIQAMVWGIKDIHGNALADTVTWNFTVDVHPLQWTPQVLEVQLYRGERVPVSVNLSYAGVRPDTIITDGYNDAWMTLVNERNVPMPRGEKQVITPAGIAHNFMLDARMLTPGVYQDTLHASIHHYDDRLLPVKITVLAQPPLWTVNPSMFESSMNIMANFRVDQGSLSSDTMDIISVWINEEPRGVAKISQVSGHYVAYVTVYGNAPELGDTLAFRIWDASAGIEYNATPAQALTFDYNKIYGSTRDPKILEVSLEHDRARYIQITPGWNWISFNTLSSDMSVQNMLRTLAASPGDVIKTQWGQSNYVDGLGWYSTDELDTLTTVDGYWLYTQSNQKIRFTGDVDDTRTKVLFKGWNLIGNPSAEEKPVDGALAIAGNKGKFLKSNRQIAEFIDGKWQGSLKTLVPGKAYMLQIEGNESSIVEFRGGRVSQENGSQWIGNMAAGHINVNSFENNLTVVSTFEEGASVSNDDVIVAYSGEELRGYGTVRSMPLNGKMYVSMMIFGNDTRDSLTFEFHDSKGKVRSLVEKTIFTPFARLGSYGAPLVFHFSGEQKQTSGETNALGASAYPNPTRDLVKIDVENVEPGQAFTIRIYNQVGIAVREVTHEATDLITTGEINMTGLPQGMYQVTITSGKSVKTLKLVKL